MCKRIYKSFKYEDGVFYFPQKCFCPGDLVRIVLCQNFCGEDCELPVSFEFDGVKIEALNKYGDIATLSDLMSRKLYCGWYSTKAGDTILIPNTGRY